MPLYRRMSDLPRRQRLLSTVDPRSPKPKSNCHCTNLVPNTLFCKMEIETAINKHFSLTGASLYYLWKTHQTATLNHTINVECQEDKTEIVEEQISKRRRRMIDLQINHFSI